MTEHLAQHLNINAPGAPAETLNHNSINGEREPTGGSPLISKQALQFRERPFALDIAGIEG